MTLYRSNTSHSTLVLSSDNAARSKKTTSDFKSLNNSFSSTLKSLLGKPNPWADVPTSSLLSPAKTAALAHMLSLPLNTHLLATNIAWLGSPLSRSETSAWPMELCEAHAWFEPRYLSKLTELVRRELWDRSEGLYAFPKEFLGEKVRRILYETLVPLRRVFKQNSGSERVEIIGKPLEAFGKGGVEQKKCLACDLSLVFRDTKVVEALATLCKGRKRHHYAWPELLAFLEPVKYGTDENWRRRWLKEGIDVRRGRQKVRLWRECGGGNQVSDRSDEEGEEVIIFNSPTPTPSSIPTDYTEEDLASGWYKEGDLGFKQYNVHIQDELEAADDGPIIEPLREGKELWFEKREKVDGGWAPIIDESTPTNGEGWDARAEAYRTLGGKRTTVTSLQN